MDHSLGNHHDDTGIFTHDLLAEIVDRCDPPTVMKLYYTIPMMKEYVKNPYNLQRLASRFNWFIKASFSDFIRTYETKYYTDQWSRHFDQEHRSILAAQSGTVEIMKECLSDIEVSGTVRNFDLVWKIQDNLYFSDRPELIAYCHDDATMKNLKDLINRTCQCQQTLDFLHREYQNEIPIPDHQLRGHLETHPTTKNLWGRVIWSGDLILFKLLIEKNQLGDVNSKHLVDELVAILGSDFYGCVIGSQGNEIYQLFAPHVQSLSSYWLEAIGSRNLERIDRHCGDLYVKLDNISDQTKLWQELRLVTKGLVQHMSDYKLISYVEKYIPQKHFQTWKNALISRCPPFANFNIIEYLLVDYHPEIPYTLQIPLFVQPCTLKLLIQHTNFDKLRVDEVIDQMKDYCMPGTIEELRRLAS